MPEIDSMRSFLIVNGHSTHEFARALQAAVDSGADALVCDFSDFAGNREQLAAFKSWLRGPLRAKERPGVCVRISPVSHPLVETELDALRDCLSGVAFRGVCMVMARVRSYAEITHLDAKLNVLEAIGGLREGGIFIVAEITPEAALAPLMSDPGPSPRLQGLTWLAMLPFNPAKETFGDNSGIGASGGANRLLRACCVMHAEAMGVLAIDGPPRESADRAQLLRQIQEAREDGFWAQFAAHARQVPFINAAFTPNSAAITHHSRVLEAFDRVGAEGVARLDGQVLQRRHRLRARRLLARAGEAQKQKQKQKCPGALDRPLEPE